MDGCGAFVWGVVLRIARILVPMGVVAREPSWEFTFSLPSYGRISLADVTRVNYIPNHRRRTD
jgi:hypothetical protein